MEIQYDIHTSDKVSGYFGECKYVVLRRLKPLTKDGITPTWWYAPAPVVMSFLEGSNLKGKTVIPFMTNAGWPGHVIKDMTQAAEKSGAVVEHAHEFRSPPSLHASKR